MRRLGEAVAEAVESDQFELALADFASARESGATAGTAIEQQVGSLAAAPEIFHRTVSRTDDSGRVRTNVISPVIIPRDGRSFLWVFVAVVLAVVGLGGGGALEAIGAEGVGGAFFGIHYWLLLAAYVAFSVWRNSYVMIPDGCTALITRHGKLVDTVPAGRTVLLDPWRKVSYVVNTTKEYPYNAPIREAPTASRVTASVDLFLQFRIEDPAEFIFTLGGVNGFSEKLVNAISEATRSLIYEQQAEEIYDLVGESTQPLLDALNAGFRPAVRFVNANITHAEPSSSEYRRDLAAAEIVRVAKEAYTFEHELAMRKERDEGELNTELAGLRETLSQIRAEVAHHQARIDTAREKEVNRAEAYARRLLVEAESEARVAASLLEAQSLDIRALNLARHSQILEYRYQQEVLDKIESIAERMPQLVAVGDGEGDEIDLVALAARLLGTADAELYSAADLEAMRRDEAKIAARVKERAGRLESAAATAGDVADGGEPT